MIFYKFVAAYFLGLYWIFFKSGWSSI